MSKFIVEKQPPQLQITFKPVSLMYLRYVRTRQLCVLLLQHCAILSQLNRHDAALELAKSSAKNISQASLQSIEILKARKDNELIKQQFLEEQQKINEAWEVLHEEEMQKAEREKIVKTSIKQTGIQANLNEQRAFSTKKERRGRNGRKPAIQPCNNNSIAFYHNGYSQNLKIETGSFSGTSIQDLLKNGSGLKENNVHRQTRSISTYSRCKSASKQSVYSGSQESGSQASSNLRSIISSQIARSCISASSKKTHKSLKSINASLERVHTFGMAQVHRSKFETEKIDMEYETIGSKLKPKKQQIKLTQKNTEPKRQDNFQINKIDLNKRLPKNFGKEGGGKLIAKNLASSDDGRDFLSRGSSEMRTEEEKVSNAPKIKQVKIQKTSYYIKEKTQPLKNHSDNIENLLLSFFQQQTTFLDLMFYSNGQFFSDNNKSNFNNLSMSEMAGFNAIRGLLDGCNSMSSQGSKFLKDLEAPSETASRSGRNDLTFDLVKNLKLSFQSLEEIERIKRDHNMYKKTQRNQLGIAKPSAGIQDSFGQTFANHQRKNNQTRLNWIDLFNIGNVMLMRGQDIQMSHTGNLEFCEFDSLQQIIDFQSSLHLVDSQGSESGQFPQKLDDNTQNIQNMGANSFAQTGKSSKSGNSFAFQTNILNNDQKTQTKINFKNDSLRQHYNSLDPYIPELNLQRCEHYAVAKDSFTEIILLTVISFFCISTEHRFINMNNEKTNKTKNEEIKQSESNQQSQTPVISSGRLILQRTQNNIQNSQTAEYNSRSLLLNNSSQSQQVSQKSINSVSTLQRSTKDRTGGTSIQKAENSKLGQSEGNSSKLKESLKRLIGGGITDNKASILSPVGKSQREEITEYIGLSVELQQEYFLCKALHFGLLYLPPDSPLVQHLTQNYLKNYLQPRIREREKMVEKFLM